MEGAWLLAEYSPSQRTELQSLAHSTWSAIDALNAQDKFGKACCWLSREDEPQTALEELVAHALIPLTACLCTLPDLARPELH